MQKIKKILLSQPKPTADKSPYFDIENKDNVTIDFKPFLKVEPIAAKEFRQQKINILDYSAVIFTAKTGIDHFFRLSEEMRIQVPDAMKYFCISESVALYLQKHIQYRKRKIFFGNGVIDDLISVISKHPEEKFLVAVSDVHDKNKCVHQKKDIIDYMEESKLTYTKAVMYKTVSVDLSADPEFPLYDMLVFFSPSGINSLFQNFPDFKQENVKIGCMGPATIKAATDRGLTVDVQAPTPENPSMSSALENFILKNNKGK